MATENTNASLKYGDIISKDLLINSGSPAVYQLRPKKNEIGTLKRMTLGEKNPNKINKTILLVGETGAGKSMLINALVNFAMGVKWEDKVWFQIVEDEKKEQSESQTSDVIVYEKKGQSESQTSDVIVYEIFGFEDKTLPYSLTIIDTPGFGDTEGIERDERVSQRLLDLFRSEEGVHELNAVGLVLKSTENRLSGRLMYILDSVMSLFGKNMEKNIVALMTHSDGLTLENALQALEDANIICARNAENEPLHFIFNNCQTKQKTSKNRFALKGAWDLTMDQIGQFAVFLRNTSAQNLMRTIEVLNTHVRITACVQNLTERINLTELKQTEIQQTQEALKKYEEEMKNNDKFIVEVDEPYKDKEEVDESRWWALGMNYGGNVSCKVCEENCHYPCTLAWYPEHCEVMKGGRCTSCTRKCHVDKHVKDKKIYVNKTRKVTKTIEEMKQKYDKGKAGGEKSTSLLENLTREKEELQRGKDQLLEEFFQHIAELEQIALNANSLTTLIHVEFLMEKMKEKGDTEKVQKLEEMKRRMDKGRGKGVKAAMQYLGGKLTAGAKAAKMK